MRKRILTGACAFIMALSLAACGSSSSSSKDSSSAASSSAESSSAESSSAESSSAESSSAESSSAESSSAESSSAESSSAESSSAESSSASDAKKYDSALSLFADADAKEANYSVKSSMGFEIKCVMDGKETTMTMSDKSEGDYTVNYGHVFETSSINGMGAFFDGDEKKEVYYVVGQSGVSKLEKAETDDVWTGTREDSFGDDSGEFVDSLRENNEAMKSAKLEETADGYKVTIDLNGVDPSSFFGMDEPLENVSVTGNMVFTFDKDANLVSLETKDVKVEGEGLAKGFFQSGEDTVDAESASAVINISVEYSKHGQIKDDDIRPSAEIIENTKFHDFDENPDDDDFVGEDDV